MRVHVERQILSPTAKVWVYDRTGGLGYRVLAFPEPGVACWEDVAEGAVQPEPTFELPLEALEALVAAAHDILPPSAAQQRHLDDALLVRDRLLTMVERAAYPQALS